MSNGWVVKTQVEYNYNTDKKENKKKRKQGDARGEGKEGGVGVAWESWGHQRRRGGSGGGAAQAWGTSPPRGRHGC